MVVVEVVGVVVIVVPVDVVIVVVVVVLLYLKSFMQKFYYLKFKFVLFLYT